jgi:hypothetical protein
MRAGHMEVRAIYENREASKCRRLILDSPGLSKTVVYVADGTAGHAKMAYDRLTALEVGVRSIRDRFGFDNAPPFARLFKDELKLMAVIRLFHVSDHLKFMFFKPAWNNRHDLRNYLYRFSES